MKKSANRGSCDGKCSKGNFQTSHTASFTKKGAKAPL